MEGLYTPRYEGYHFKINGLPFKPSKVVADGKDIATISSNPDKTYEFKFRKNFKQIEVFK
jgi:alpha-glucosidase